MTLSFQLGHSLLKCFVVLSLTTTSWSHDHKTMAHLNSVIELNDLEFEVFNKLQVVLITHFFQLRQQVSILLLWLLNAREQIIYNVLKQGQIINQEFRHVNIT